MGDVGYTAHLLDKKTGERATKHFFQVWDRHTEWRWGDGDRGCDCNRGKFFYGEGFNVECGSTRFIVERIVTDDGATVYEDEVSK